MNEQDGLIREINEAVNQERLQHFLVHFGRYIGATSAAIILATLAYVWWQTHVQAGYAEGTRRFYHAVKQVEDGKAYEARESFERLASGSDAKLAMLARMWLVKLKYQGGKKEEVSAMVQSLLKETEGREDLKPYHDWLTLYVPGTEEKDNTYRLTNMERLAVADMREGKTEESARIYREIADNNATPATMRERATLILSTTLKGFRAPSENLPSANISLSGSGLPVKDKQ